MNTALRITTALIIGAACGAVVARGLNQKDNVLVIAGAVAFVGWAANLIANNLGE